MPAAPEFLQRRREIRAFEIYHQLDIQKLRHASGDIGITGKIAVNLEGIEKGGHTKGDSRIGRDVIINHIHQRYDHVRDGDLLEITPGNQLRALDGSVRVKAVLLFQLGQQMLRPLDGACQKQRKERDEHSVLPEVRAGLCLSLVDVDDIAQGLEDIEGNSHRQHQVQRHRAYGQGNARKQIRQRPAQEIEVFKDEQNAQAENEGRAQAKVLLSLFLRPVQKKGRSIRDQRGQKKQGHILDACAHIEVIAGHQQDAPSIPPGRQPVDRKYNWQKQIKRVRIKQHSAVPLMSSLLL